MLPRFIELMHRWLDLRDRFEIQRLALGVVLTHQQDERLEGYERLRRYLAHTLILDPARTRELLLQINWPTESNVLPQLTVNRLSKWTVLGVKSVELRTRWSESSRPPSMVDDA